MPNIPMDIITEFFLRLPAPTLVRFRIISKTCFSLIGNPDFIASHLNHTLQTGDHLMILLRGPRLLCTVYFDAPDKVTDIEHPLKANGLTQVFGSCNGLIGLSNSPTDMALFNPSTRQTYRLPAELEHGVLASNSLHWVLPRRPGFIAFNTIIRFDLTSEEFEILDFPEVLAHENIDIGVLDGCLCLMCNHEFSYVDVWIMKEYKIVESWSKLFRVPKPKSVESLEFLKPLVYSKDRDKVCLEINNKKLVWFDLASKRFRRIRIKECDSSFSAEVLVSSLVLGCKGDPIEVMLRKEREDKICQKNNKRDDFLSKGFKLVL